MKNIFKSHVTCGLTLSLLCLGGSMQAKSLVRPSAPVRPSAIVRPSAPAAVRPSALIKPSAIIRPSAPASVATLFQKKSFFAAHPVLKWGGISLATGAVVFALIELRRGRNSGKGFVGQIRADYKSVIDFIKSKMSKNSVPAAQPALQPTATTPASAEQPAPQPTTTTPALVAPTQQAPAPVDASTATGSAQ